MTGGDDVIDAAFRRTGVLRVNNISELFYMAEILANQPRPKGPRLTIITNAGGPGVLATDALITSGGELATISAGTMEELNTLLPAAWSHNNPIDVLGDAPPDRYAKALEIAANDPESDGTAGHPHSAGHDQVHAHRRTAARIYAKIRWASRSWPVGWAAMTSPRGTDSQSRRHPHLRVPRYRGTHVHYLWQYSDNLRGLYETPAASPMVMATRTTRPRRGKMIEDVRTAGRTLLTEFESKSLLSAYGIPTVVTRIATDRRKPSRLPSDIGYPVVLKLHSHTITHKTDVGGVKLDLRTRPPSRRRSTRSAKGAIKAGGAEAFNGVTVQQMIKLSDAYELILGSSIDPDFGPVLLFGTGGQLVEVFKDRAWACRRSTPRSPGE